MSKPGRRTLSAAQTRFLLAELALSAGTRNALQRPRAVLTPEQRAELLSKTADALQQRGFGADYEPTHFGLQMEAVIDVLRKA